MPRAFIQTCSNIKRANKSLASLARPAFLYRNTRNTPLHSWRHTGHCLSMTASLQGPHRHSCPQGITMWVFSLSMQIAHTSSSRTESSCSWRASASFCLSSASGCATVVGASGDMLSFSGTAKVRTPCGQHRIRDVQRGHICTCRREGKGNRSRLVRARVARCFLEEGRLSAVRASSSSTSFSSSW